jgi:hypothetical protein
VTGPSRRPPPVGPAALDAPPLSHTPIWLSHHWADEYDRCIVIRGRRVCRRCAVLYPLALVAALVIGAGATWPAHLDPWFLWLLPLPAVIEFVAEQLGGLGHSPRRLVLLTIPLAIACGRLYVRYLDHATDRLVWTVVLVYGGVCLMAGLIRSFRPSATP